MASKTTTSKLKTLPEKKAAEVHNVNLQALREEISLTPPTIVVDKEQIYNTFLFWFSLPPKHRKTK